MGKKKKRKKMNKNEPNSKCNSLNNGTDEGLYELNNKSKRIGLYNMLGEEIEVYALLPSFKPLCSDKEPKRYTVLNVCKDDMLVADHLNVTLDGSDSIDGTLGKPRWTIDSKLMSHMVKLTGYIRTYPDNKTKYNICLSSEPEFIEDVFDFPDHGWIYIDKERENYLHRRLKTMPKDYKVVTIMRLRNDINDKSEKYLNTDFIFNYIVNTLTSQTMSIFLQETGCGNWLYNFPDLISMQMIHVLSIAWAYLNNNKIIDIYQLFRIITLACLYFQGFRTNVDKCDRFINWCAHFNIFSNNEIEGLVGIMRLYCKNFKITHVVDSINELSKFYEYMGVVNYAIEELDSELKFRAGGRY